MPKQWLLEKFKKKILKKEKKEPENEVEKRKKKRKKKKKIKDNTNAFISMTFEFETDACFLLHCFVKLYCWKFCWSVRHGEERHISLRK